MSKQKTTLISNFDRLIEYEKKGELSSLIFNSSDLAIKATTLDGNITSWNHGAEIIYGFSASEIIGKNINVLIPPDYLNQIRDTTKQIIDGKSIASLETKRIRKDNAIIDILISLSPIKDEHGNIIGIVTLDRDITKIISLNKELLVQGKEKARSEEQLHIASEELLFQNTEKENRAAELVIANKELLFQIIEKENRAAELVIANQELLFQNTEKENRAAELVIANQELLFQNNEKEKRAAELVVANKELLFQNEEKIKRASELFISNKEVLVQSIEIQKQNIVNTELVEKSNKAKKASLYSRSLIEASVDPLVTISPEGKITDVNEASIKVTGIKRNNLIGTDFSDYFTEPQKAREGYKQVFEKGIVSDYPLTIRNKNGKLTDVLYNASVYKDENGHVLGVFAAARDVMAIKQASQYARSIIEASRDPLFAVNAKGKIIDVNEATIIATHKSRTELIGADFQDYFTEKEKAELAYRKIFTDGFIFDYALTIFDGILTDVFCNGSVYKDEQGNVLGAVVVARDVTMQNKTANDLKEAIVFAELATIIAEEAKYKAESATQIAEEAVQAKQQFLSNMSHEIRTPMNAIIGFTKVVLKTSLSAKQKEYLMAIKISGDALIVLINDILDLAKVNAGKMVFEKIPFKMSLSISAMLHLFETKIQEKNLVLIKEHDSRIPDVLIGDPLRLHQIILNLVGNAVKFTSKGTIKISVLLLKEDDDSVTIEFSIADTGIGIPTDRLEHVFENFQQASSITSRLYGGTGLGLAIVKQLIESQGGTIHVKSKIEEGSTFSFILNFQKTSAMIDLAPQIVPYDLEIKNIKVLVVEDILLNQLLMKTLLDDFGFERDIAENGKIAIEKLKTKTYDIILMDLQMPEMNGFETTDHIRNVLHSNIPIIALTADVTTVDLAKCKAVGMNDYIAKPVDERVLYSKIVGLVKKPVPIAVQQKVDDTGKKYIRCINLDYLNHRTKSDPTLMMEMISLYLEQTPGLVRIMKNSLQEKDWQALYGAVHKMIPSFSIVGINIDFENMAKKVQEFASAQQQADGLPDLVLQIEKICSQACIELQEEFNIIKNSKA